MAAVVVGCAGGGGSSGVDEGEPEAAPVRGVGGTSEPVAPVTVGTARAPTERATEDTRAVGSLGGGSSTPAASTEVASRVSTPEAVIETASALRADYDSGENMYRLFSGEGHDPADTLEAIELSVLHRDRSMVPVMIEMLRFFGDYVHEIEARKALIEITGREVRRNEGLWKSWMEWLVNNSEEYRPPAGYLEWKIMLMSLIDPRFEEFLRPAAVGSRVNVFELAWGGVEPDGIPDLRNSPVVLVSEQDYLQQEDRVFGVSINGEHRAYPLRVVNAHEMANDVLGGEPIALAY